MRLAITAQVTVFYDVPEEGDNIAELCDNIENGIQHLFDQGLLTGDTEDAECLTFECSFAPSEFIVLLVAADHIGNIKADLRYLGHYVSNSESDANVLARAVDQGLVDEEGMYDPSEAKRQYARNIMEDGL